MNHQLAKFNVEFSIECNSEHTLLLSWSELICSKQHQRIIDIQQQIKSQFPQQIIETIVSYNSLIIYYDFISLPTAQLVSFIEKIKPAISTQFNTNEHNNTAIEIPVYYGDECGWDLATVAAQTGLSSEEVIQLHSQETYRAYALGFTPGFCYLGQVNNQLNLPRKSTPRLKVPRGAVAIAAEQTAVYPNQSPGGWHILGQTPLPMYEIVNKGNDEKFLPLISVGQQVKFTPIDKTTFTEMGGVISREGTRQ
jgi:KipI family sensor histidine kinase inhibitor